MREIVRPDENFSVRILEGDSAVMAATDFLETMNSDIGVQPFDPEQKIAAHIIDVRDQTAGMFLGVDQGRKIYGTFLVVAPAFRKTGLGEKLIDSVKRAYDEVELRVSPLEDFESHGKQYAEALAALRKMYESYGFRNVSPDDPNRMIWTRT